MEQNHIGYFCFDKRYRRQKEDKGRRQTSENKVGDPCFVTDVDPTGWTAAMWIVRLYSQRAQWFHIGHIGVSLVKQSASQWLYKKVVWITYGFYCIHNTMPMPTSPRILLLDKEISSKVQKLKRKFPVEIKYIFHARIYRPEIKYESVGYIKQQCGGQMYTT